MISPSVEETIGSGALLVRAPELGTIAVTGPDRQSWLNGLMTSDLAHLSPGEVSYGLVLIKIGRILADVWVMHAGERLLLGVLRDRVPLLREHFEKYLVMEDAAHADVSLELAWAFAHGPSAAELARAMATRHGGFAGTANVTGVGDAAIALPSASFESALAEAPSLVAGVSVGSQEQREALRVQRFLPRFGVDFGEKTYPQEAALEKIAVSFHKGCYLGQEVVCRLEMRGHVVKKIVPLRLAGADLPATGTEVKSNEGKVLGSITSAAASHGNALALAMVRVDFTEPGVELDVAGRKATVLGPAR